MTTMKLPSHIIWDWNGTLLDDTDLSHKAVNDVFIKHDIPTIELEEWRRAVTIPILPFYEDYLRIHKPEADRDFIISILKEWSPIYERERHTVTLHKDVLEILNFFQSKNIPQSILSAHEEVYLLSAIKEYKVTQYLHHISGMDLHKGGHSKVDKGKSLLRNILETQSDISSENILIIGDTLHDLEVARALNINCVLIADGLFHPERLNGHGVEVYSNLGEFLESINK